MLAEGVNWISTGRLDKPSRLKVKIRYGHKGANALVKDLGQSRALVEFNEAQEAITPGQATVFYKKETVVGGGWIKESVK